MKLTAEEKIRIVTGDGMWHTHEITGKLPAIHLADGPHGLRKQEEKVRENNKSKQATCFPTASAIACSWDETAVAKMAEGIAAEALREDVSVVLGPGVNMKRSPLCGRNFEYFSEDPYLAGRLGIAYVKAMQAMGVGTSLKHFAGNNQETHRQTSNSQIDERALREIYLKAFEMVVKEAKPATIMASYNRLNGTYACENKWLLTEVLRKEWEYEGAVISDWGACANLPVAIDAGMDLEMPDSRGNHEKDLRIALKNGELSQQELDRAAKKVATLIETYDVAKRNEEQLQKAKVDCGNNHKLAKELCEQSAVLLKNDGILPLEKTKPITLIGSLAEQMRFQGGGSSHITTGTVTTAVEAITALGYETRFFKGYSIDTEEVDEALEQQVLEKITLEDTVLFFGGLTDITEGEGFDRTHLKLPQNQIHLLEQILEKNKNVLFVSFAGSPYVIPHIEKLRAILHMYLGGEAVGEACASLLAGEVNPSGKLAETFPRSLEDVPCKAWYATGSDDVEYRESIFIGYRYYDTFKKKVAFPFGYGLSYTTYKYEDLVLDTDKYQGGTLTLSFTIKNQGKMAGAEVIQLYVKNPMGKFIRAEKELRGFQKIWIQPGEEKRVTMELQTDAFAIYDVARQTQVVPSGVYEILVAASSRDIRLQEFLYVQGEDYKIDQRELLQEYFNQGDGSFRISKQQFEKLYQKPLSHFDEVKKGEYTVCNSLNQLAAVSVFAKVARTLACWVVYAMFRGKNREDPQVKMMLEGVLDGTVDNIACQGGMPYRIVEAMVLCANGLPGKAFIKLIRG